MKWILPMSSDKDSDERSAWYRRQARKIYHDEGTIEIDDNAPISQAEGNPDRGAYVQAWVWVMDARTEWDDALRDRSEI